MDKTAKRILYEAERKLQKGWSQGWSTRSKDGTPLDLHLIGQGYKPASFGLLGAIGHTVMWNPNSAGYAQAIEVLKLALARKTKKKINFDKLVAWNDSPKRKKQDVIDLVNYARTLV